MDKCPKCGAVRSPGEGARVYFKCETYLRAGTDIVMREGRACLENQVEQAKKTIEIYEVMLQGHLAEIERLKQFIANYRYVESENHAGEYHCVGCGNEPDDPCTETCPYYQEAAKE